VGRPCPLGGYAAHAPPGRQAIENGARLVSIIWAKWAPEVHLCAASAVRLHCTLHSALGRPFGPLGPHTVCAHSPHTQSARPPTRPLIRHLNAPSCPQSAPISLIYLGPLTPSSFLNSITKFVCPPPGSFGPTSGAPSRPDGGRP